MQLEEETIELRVRQFASWVQMDLERVIDSEWANAKVFASHTALMLANSMRQISEEGKYTRLDEVMNVGYKVDVAYRVANESFFEVPDTWWDHFKQDCFPAWAQARWPVKKRVVEYAIELNMPSIPIPKPTSNFYYATPKAKDEDQADAE